VASGGSGRGSLTQSNLSSENPTVALAGHVPRSLWARWGLPRSARLPLLRGVGSVYPPAVRCQRGSNT